jgi:hypothetical protein
MARTRQYYMLPFNASAGIGPRIATISRAKCGESFDVWPYDNVRGAADVLRGGLLLLQVAVVVLLLLLLLLLFLEASTTQRK